MVLQIIGRTIVAPCIICDENDDISCCTIVLAVIFLPITYIVCMFFVVK